MLRQESLKRVFYELIEVELVEPLKAEGFKFSKTKSQFTKSANGFEQIIETRLPYSPLAFDDSTNSLYFQIDLVFFIQSSKFDKWYKENYDNTSFVKKEFGEFKTAFNIDFDVFRESDFFSPTPSHQFKRSIGMSLMQSGEKHEYNTSLYDFLNNGISDYIEKLRESSNHIAIFESRKTDNDFQREITYATFLVYFKDFDRAKQHYFNLHTEIVEKLIQWRIQTTWDSANYLSLIKSIVKDAKNFVGLELNVPEPLPLESSFRDIKIDIPNTEFSFEESFSLIKHSREITSFCIDKTGRVIVGYQSLGEQYVCIWDKEGKLLLEFELDYGKGYYRNTVIVGYLENCDMFFANCYLINRNLEYFKLELPLNPPQKQLLSTSFDIPIVYDKVNDLFIAYYHYRTDQECYIVFYDKNYKLVKTLKVTLRPSDIIVEKQWILLLETSKQFVIIDYDGNEIKKLESNNAWAAQANYTNNRSLAISKSKQYLFSGGYYTKSFLFDLSTFKRDVLWGHTTFEKDYAELHYNDIHNNFGINYARFSPNEKYLIGGAEHGKYVAWTIPDKKRIELIPNQEYLNKMPDAKIIDINGKMYLRNRGHDLINIQFLENGKFFTFRINNDLLIWNDSFEHISTITDIGNLGANLVFGHIGFFYENFLGILYTISTGRKELIILKRY